MDIVSTWKEAPRPVKWTSLLWFVLGIGAIISLLLSLLMLLNLPVNGMTGIVVIVTSLQIGVAGLIAVASWKFLFRASWGRVVLEIVTWITLAFYAGFGMVWVGSALANWSKFKTETAAELPQISPELKLIAVVLIIAVLVLIGVVVVSALRASVTRKYVSKS